MDLGGCVPIKKIRKNLYFQTRKITVSNSQNEKKQQKPIRQTENIQSVADI